MTLQSDIENHGEDDFAYLLDGTGMAFFVGNTLLGFIGFDDLPELMVDIAEILKAGRIRPS
jgi:hypothetical protein